MKTAKRKTLVQIISSIVIFVIGVACFLFCLAAIIPPLSNTVEPIIKWILTAKTFEGETGIPIQLLAIGFPLSVTAIGVGIKLFGRGYSNLLDKYYNAEMNRIEK